MLADHLEAAGVREVGSLGDVWFNRIRVGNFDLSVQWPESKGQIANQNYFSVALYRTGSDTPVPPTILPQDLRVHFADDEWCAECMPVEAIEELMWELQTISAGEGGR